MRKKKQVEEDVRIKKKRYFWREYALTYFILLVLSAGQWMIYNEYEYFGNMPTDFIFGMLGYWALVSAVFSLITHLQIRKNFEEPMRRLSKAAKEVASGDFSVYVEPIHTSDKLNYMDVMFMDFNKMVEELGSIETLKNDFVANVSHEAKTPLSIIKNYAVALKKEGLSPELRNEYMDTIITASENLTALVTNILKLSKLENQEIIPAAESFNLSRQLSDCALVFVDAMERKNIEFEADIEERVTVRADEGMLEIVWHNLLSNAIKFTEQGGKITLKQTSDEDTVTVSVSDTGCGMDRETMNHIFDKFYQGDTSHSGEGNGLGLALVSRVIDLSDGSITVNSKPGEGTTFTVNLKIG